MPSIPPAALNNLEDNAIRVLLTGFGPFAHFKENPSWLAAKPLHNKILAFNPPAAPITVNEDVVMSETGEADIPPPPSQIHITTCEVPVSYESVLAIVPPFHARPPVLPESHDPTYPNIPPPEQGFDLCLHVGVAGRGPLRVERLGHKKGYNMKDCGGKLAPIVPVKPVEAERGPAVSDPDPLPTLTPSTPSDAERMEMERLGYDADPFGRLESNEIDGGDIPSRGFPKGYEAFDDEIHTGIDTLKLISFMKETGFEDIYTSMDAGHYLCDYIYYCSLAEAKRANRNDIGKNTKVLFLHCPPVGQPHTTQEVTDAIMKIVTWVCNGLQSGDSLSSTIGLGST